jgi:hypothetical protein
MQRLISNTRSYGWSPPKLRLNSGNTTRGASMGLLVRETVLAQVALHVLAYTRGHLALSQTSDKLRFLILRVGSQRDLPAFALAPGPGRLPDRCLGGVL